MQASDGFKPSHKRIIHVHAFSGEEIQNRLKTIESKSDGRLEGLEVHQSPTTIVRTNGGG